MKRITHITLMIFLFSTTINAQENYTNLWKKVQQFEVENLPKSALKVVEEIYAKAEKDNNSPQIVKTLFYKSKFALILEEDAQLKVVNQFKEHIAKSSFPTKNVLENILANLYWQYFNEHRWQFYNRTETAEKVNSNDFRTWDLDTLFKEVQQYYNASLQDKNRLQEIDIRRFQDILHTAKGSTTYRPSLYDFLAQNALQFYKTTENNITKPAYQFKIDNSNLLSVAKTFAKLNLVTKDTLSLQFNALKTYQDLIAFHLKSNNLKALADVDLQRLSFVKQHATFPDKEALYINVLKTSRNNYKGNEIAGLYGYELAKNYNEQANTYQPNKNEKNRFKRKEALAICNEVRKQFPKSDGAKKCTLLQHQILSKSLQIQTEKYSSIESYSRVLVNYKNVKDLYFSIYKINQNEIETFQKIHLEEKRIDFINTLTQIKNWCSDLKNEGDYQQHSTEIIIPKLAQGSYLFVSSSTAKINANATIGTADIQVTNLAFINNNEGGKNTYQVVDRITGKPIIGAKVLLSNKPYQRYGDRIHKNFTTDKNGEFQFNSFKKYYSNVNAIVTYKNDEATFGEILY